MECEWLHPQATHAIQQRETKKNKKQKTKKKKKKTHLFFNCFKRAAMITG